MLIVTPSDWIWLGLALTAVALLSHLIARRQQACERVALEAQRLTDDINRYAVWLCEQRTPLGAGGGLGRCEAAHALCDAELTCLGSFPMLAHDMARLHYEHARLQMFLDSQEAMRRSDAERWLLSEHDARVQAMVGEQMAIVLTLQSRLAELATGAPLPWVRWPGRTARRTADEVAATGHPSLISAIRRWA